ncbi:hypothetical protein D9757_003911 [Collybiopsis confluens]|uniref:Uncharacterized protein n=1 Tax=Collybiopsis confluens TaxID=2823264 RepID=A0A8H5HWT3_9AGAR|nr:hypothetical protein D9757_003911 [Collybiopsis confluens]
MVNDSPLRQDKPGGTSEKYNDCVDEENGLRLEAGWVLEKIWLKKRYSLVYDGESRDSLLLVYNDQTPPIPPATESSSPSPLPVSQTSGSRFASELFYRPTELGDIDSGSDKGDMDGDKDYDLEWYLGQLTTQYVEDPMIAKRFHDELLPKFSEEETSHSLISSPQRLVRRSMPTRQPVVHLAIPAKSHQPAPRTTPYPTGSPSPAPRNHTTTKFVPIRGIRQKGCRMIRN